MAEFRRAARRITLPALNETELLPQPQDDTQATRAPLLKKETVDSIGISPASQIYNRIRGLDPWPGAFTYFRAPALPCLGQAGGRAPWNGQHRLRHDSQASRSILWVACGDGTWLRLTELKLEGHRRITPPQNSRMAPTCWMVSHFLLNPPRNATRSAKKY